MIPGSLGPLIVLRVPARKVVLEELPSSRPPDQPHKKAHSPVRQVGPVLVHKTRFAVKVLDRERFGDPIVTTVNQFLTALQDDPLPRLSSRVTLLFLATPVSLTNFDKFGGPMN